MSSRNPSARAQAAARLRELMEIGETGIPAPVAPRPARARPPRAESAAVPAGPAAAAPSGDWQELNLPGLAEYLRDCARCRLCEGRSQVVFGAGNPRARLLFVGEGPGQEEDQRGEPFVGRAGQLLTDMIEKGMGLRREDVYIANVVKCRPPENRNPEPDEIAACSPFLKRQLALVSPQIIVALGKFAAQTLLKSQVPISKLRGHWHECEGIPLMPTFHPAYLMRNPAEKRNAWEDLKAVMARLG